jgi:folate-binding protein YgfZ
VTTVTQLPGYEAARIRAAFFPQPQVGVLRITGYDRMSFIQRQTTNDIAQLKREQVLLSVLTSPMGRILDVFTLFLEPEALVLLPLPGKVESTAKYLNSRIFFMDQVEITNASNEFGRFNLFGPQSVNLLTKLGFQYHGLPGLWHGTLAGYPVQVLDGQDLMGVKKIILVPLQSAPHVETLLREEGFVYLDSSTIDILRIEAGLPGSEQELTDEYTPLEVGLRNAISVNKGCYTGQEVLARQINYDKVTRSLVRLQLDAETKVGVGVSVEGKPVGQITSASVSPRFGPIALGVLKRPAGQPGTQVIVGDPQVHGVVVDAPFTQIN